MLANDIILHSRYKIVRLLAKGGMGAVYEAKDTRLGSTTVAVKETFFTDKALSTAFEYEAILLAKLRHSGLPRVMDHFSEGDGQFLVMEFIEGTDLGEMLKVSNGALNPEDVFGWMAQVLDTLNYLHSFDPPIIHRDLKPPNIKLTPQGQVIVLDFGLAKNQEQSLVAGYTLYYAAPEQMTGVGTEPRSDLYSFAATSYHLLTGTPPIDAMTRMIALNEGKADPLKPVNQLNPQIPQSVADLLMKAMILDKNQRFSSALEMFQVLSESVVLPEYRLESRGTGMLSKGVSKATSKLDAVSTQVQGQKVNNLPQQQRLEPAPPIIVTPPPAKPSTNPILAVGLIVIITLIGIIGYKLLPTTAENIVSSLASASKEVSALEFYLETDSGKQLTGANPFFLEKNQRFRFHFSPKERGYVYIISPSENSFATMLTKQPQAASGLETNLVEAGKDLSFPAKGWLRTVGAGYYWTVIFSSKPLEKPKFLAAPAGKQLNDEEQKELNEMIAGFTKQYGREPKIIDSGSNDKPSRSVMVTEEQTKNEFLIFKVLIE